MTLTITAVEDLDSEPPRMVLAVHSTNVGPLAVPDNSTIAVYRVHNDGTRYRVLTEVNARVSGGEWNGYDYHSPYNHFVTYLVVAAGHESAETTGLFLDAVDPLGRPVMWLIHNSAPELSVPVAFIAGFGELDRPWNGELHEIAQSPYPLPRALGPRKAGNSDLTVAVLPDQLAAVNTLIADSGTILVNWPAQPGRDINWLWIQPLGVKIGRTPGQRGGLFRTVAIPYAIVAQPDVDLTPVWTDGDLRAAYATDGDVRAAYLTDRGRRANLTGT